MILLGGGFVATWHWCGPQGATYAGPTFRGGAGGGAFNSNREVPRPGGAMHRLSCVCRRRGGRVRGRGASSGEGAQAGWQGEAMQGGLPPSLPSSLHHTPDHPPAYLVKGPHLALPHTGHAKVAAGGLRAPQQPTRSVLQGVPCHADHVAAAAACDAPSLLRLMVAVAGGGEASGLA